jgi:C4-dicarboxylate transporter DctQ subunit
MIGAALCVVYALIVTVGGWQYVRKMHDVGIEMQDLPIPQWLPRIIVPLGFALLALRFGQAFVRLVRGEDAKLLSDEAEEALKLRQEGGVDLGEVRE